MDLSSAPSGRSYIALPIDATQGFPQSFSFAFNTVTYLFSLYVNVQADQLSAEDGDLFDLPTDIAFLVLRVDVENAEGARSTLFLRKVVPELEYTAGPIALYFPEQVIARQNLNGMGDFGSRMTGGIAQRWA